MITDYTLLVNLGFDKTLMKITIFYMYFVIILLIIYICLIKSHLIGTVLVIVFTQNSPVKGV